MANQNEKPEGEDIYIKENLVFLVQLKMRSKVLKTLKENFNVKEILVISEKKDEEKI